MSAIQYVTSMSRIGKSVQKSFQDQRGNKILSDKKKKLKSKLSNVI